MASTTGTLALDDLGEPEFPAATLPTQTFGGGSNRGDSA